NSDVPDHQIIATAIELDDELSSHRGKFEGEDGYSKVILLSQDRIQRVFARSVYGVQAEELRSVCAPEYEYKRGIHRVELTADQVDAVIRSGEYQLTREPHANDL